MRKFYGRGGQRDITAPPMREKADTHCQICERDIYANNLKGLIAHHGYRRPGYGEQTSSCYGARWQPFEESRSAIPHYITVLKVAIEETEDHIARTKGAAYSWSEHREKKKPKHMLDFDVVHFKPQPENPEEHKKYLDALARRLRGEEGRLKALNGEVTRLQARHDNWKSVEDLSREG